MQKCRKKASIFSPNKEGKKVRGELWSFCLRLRNDNTSFSRSHHGSSCVCVRALQLAGQVFSGLVWSHSGSLCWHSLDRWPAADGNFTPAARCCSPDLHLVKVRPIPSGRNRIRWPGGVVCVLEGWGGCPYLLDGRINMRVIRVLRHFLLLQLCTVHARPVAVPDQGFFFFGSDNQRHKKNF